MKGKETTSELRQTTKKRKKETILVVEDEIMLRRLLVMTLRSEGYTVIDADNGSTGLALALKHHPQLILLDILMPSMNGIGMLKLLRKDTWGKKSSVILLTNLGDTESIISAKDYGVTDYLIKSEWSLDELADEIKSKLLAA